MTTTRTKITFKLCERERRCTCFKPGRLLIPRWSFESYEESCSLIMSLPPRSTSREGVYSGFVVFAPLQPWRVPWETTSTTTWEKLTWSQRCDLKNFRVFKAPEYSLEYGAGNFNFECKSRKVCTFLAYLITCFYVNVVLRLEIKKLFLFNLT